jgi:DNA processing protein
MSDGRLARVALSRVVEPGNPAIWAAVQERGPEDVWAALRAGTALPGLSAAMSEGAAVRAAGHDPARDLEALHRAGGRLVCPGDQEWPEHRLTWPVGGAGHYAPPLALYVRGTRSLAETVERSVAVVGARAATAYGVHVAGELGLGLADRDCAVVSGGAYGIDAAAHRGALLSDRGATIAVLACGIDIAYPRGNDRLLDSIGREGLLVSELPPGCAPTRIRFLVRNRIIAALTLGTVVVEAAVRSGSLATAARARDLQRFVMAVPGPVTSAMSAGAHAELRRAGTMCVTSAAEVLDTVGRMGDDAAEPARASPAPRDQLDETVRRVLDAVPVRAGAGEASIAKTAGVSPLVVQQVLPPLLVAGLVERVDSGWRLTSLGAGRPAPQPARR